MYLRQTALYLSIYPIDVYVSVVNNRVKSPTIFTLIVRKGKTMRRLRSGKRQCNNLYFEKSLLKYPKDVFSIDKATSNTKSVLEFHSRKINKPTRKSKQKIHTTDKFCSMLSKKALKTPPQTLNKTGVQRTSRLKTTLYLKKGSAADKVKSQLKSGKEQNASDKKFHRISQTKLLKSQNKIKESQGQNELHHDIVFRVSKFRQESPNKTTRSSRYSMRLQSNESSKNNSENLQLSVLPKFKKRQDILNEKISCMPKKLQCKSSAELKELQRENEFHHDSVILASGLINESPNHTTRSLRSTKSCKSVDVLLSKVSASPVFNEKKPCMPKKLQCKSLSKIKNVQEQTEVDRINVSGFINKPSNKTTRLSSRRSTTSQSPEFLKYRTCSVRVSKLSISPKFKKRQYILNEKTPCNPKEVRLRSSKKIKDLQGQNKIQNESAINMPILINESPNETARSSRKSLRLQTQEFLSEESENVKLSKFPVSLEFKKKQSILNEKTPCVPKKLRLKSLNKRENLQEFNKTAVTMSEVLNESVNGTARSSSKSISKRLLPQEFSKNKSDNAQLSKRLKNSKIQPKAKQLMTPKTKSNKHLSFTPKNTSTVVKRRAQKLTENIQKPKRHKSCIINIPVDDLACSPVIQRQTKSDGYKMPGINTLKRKRLVIEAMKKADEDYEDDIYEEKEFDNFKNILPDTSDSELSYTMATPKLGCHFTPRIKCKTPVFKDCFSPRQYALSRKVAEECFYRKKKRRSKSKPENPAAVPEKKKIEFDEILEKASKVKKDIEKLAVEESDCEDDYFTDDEK